MTNVRGYSGSLWLSKSGDAVTSAPRVVSDDRWCSLALTLTTACIHNQSPSHGNQHSNPAAWRSSINQFLFECIPQASGYIASNALREKMLTHGAAWQPS